ncbi:MAG TPA: SDR family oxidoreductase [Sphingomicrobium sp.]|nr:SDR family oxidoreductase [Sphingomicrobium sp.]
MKKLQGKVAVITGGSAGIGLAIAKAFVDEGAHVYITGRREAELDAAVQQLGGNATGVRGDVTSLAALDRLYASVAARRRVDIVVANAGRVETVTLDRVTEGKYEQIFDTNVKGVLFTVQKALPLLNDGGSIIVIGSVAGAKGYAGSALYGASKAAVRNFVRGWTMELKDRRIRANVLSPGPINTDAVASVPADIAKALISAIPMGRLGEANEVASAALFLASADSSFITGIELFVDGGRAQV